MLVRHRVFVTLVSVSTLAVAMLPAVVAGGGTAAAAPFTVKSLNPIQKRLISSELINRGNQAAVTPSLAGDDEGQGPDGAP
ncbi:MAG: hypothetical protein QOE07_152, partial [Acidimicrobiaceae bacterium]|nr:hypothetical protein [Acidimicrobiaceae bacterium]